MSAVLCLRPCWLVVGVSVFAAALSASAQDSLPWKVASQRDDLTIYERPRKGSELHEFKAVGPIAAAPEVVRRVLDDVPAYPTFMPYVAEARVISQDSKSRVSYQRIALPLVSDRDYTVRVKLETRRTPEGLGYFNRWQTANDLGPAPRKGVTRVAVTEGYWQLEPTEGGRATRATYAIFSDSGGSLPTGLLNSGSRTAIPKLFDGVRKQARLEKYAKP